MKKIIMTLILLAMLTVLLASCKTNVQLTDRSPTEAEIAEFRRTHPVDEIEYEPIGSMASSQEKPDDIALYWFGGFDVILTVEVIGENEIEYVNVPFATNGEIYNYRVVITDVIALKAESHNFIKYKIGDEIYLRFGINDPVYLSIKETYVITGRNRHEDGMKNGLPVTFTNPRSLYYITDNSYVIDMVKTDGLRNHTGKSLEVFKNELVRFVTDEQKWSSDDRSSSNIVDQYEELDDQSRYEDNGVDGDEIDNDDSDLHEKEIDSMLDSGADGNNSNIDDFSDENEEMK